MKLFFVTDGNQQRLVRSKMLSIFKPAVRRVIADAATSSHQNIFGGDNVIIEKLKEHKQANQVLKLSLLRPQNPGKGKGKPNKKGASQKLKGPRAKGRQIPTKCPTNRTQESICCLWREEVYQQLGKGQV